MALADRNYYVYKLNPALKRVEEEDYIQLSDRTTKRLPCDYCKVIGDLTDSPIRTRGRKKKKTKKKKKNIFWKMCHFHGPISFPEEA